MTGNGHIDPRGSMAPPIIMRTAATPMPTPKSSLGPESILGDELMYREGIPQYSEVGLGFSEPGVGRAESRRGSSTSMDPYDPPSLVSYVNDFAQRKYLFDNVSRYSRYYLISAPPVVSNGRADEEALELITSLQMSQFTELNQIRSHHD